MEKREHAPLTLPKKVLSLAGFRENRNQCTPTKAKDNIDNPEVLNTNTNKGQAKKQKKKKKDKKTKTKVKTKQNKNKSHDLLPHQPQYQFSLSHFSHSLIPPLQCLCR